MPRSRGFSLRIGKTGFDRGCRVGDWGCCAGVAGGQEMAAGEDFRLIPGARVPSQWSPTMGQQSKKIIKRRRRADYLKRKKEQAKLGGLVKKPAVKKEAPAAAKKAPAKKAAAKKAPAKKAAKKVTADSAESLDQTVPSAASAPEAADAAEA